MLLKVCGVSAERDLAMLAAAGVDLVGLWYGVPGGEAELSAGELVRLAAAARESGLEPILVTLTRDPSVLACALRTSGVTGVQLHGYQLPHVVRALKASLWRTGATVVKTLHIRRNRCVELGLVRAYERAEVDAFLLDTTGHDGRLGSTGEPIAPAMLSVVAGQLDRPFFLAGGISATRRRIQPELMRLGGFAGVDVSTAARDRDGRLSRRRVQAIRRAWPVDASEQRDVVLH
jgi:phosphoribosylanthranilate isomerase